MASQQHHSCTDALERYGAKCKHHLSRVRLSHVLALKQLEVLDRIADVDIDKLIQASTDSQGPGTLNDKLWRHINEVHLIALKLNFELYLNRSITALWRSHFAQLAAKFNEKHILLGRLAESLAGCRVEDAREVVIDDVVPRYGLDALGEAIKKTIGIDLEKLFETANSQYWAQTVVAFEVRHLIEHRDNKIDATFVKKVGKFWARSSWARHGAVEQLTKIEVDGQDVVETYTAMIALASSLTHEFVDREPHIH